MTGLLCFVYRLLERLIATRYTLASRLSIDATRSHRTIALTPASSTASDPISAFPVSDTRAANRRGLARGSTARTRR